MKEGDKLAYLELIDSSQTQYNNNFPKPATQVGLPATQVRRQTDSVTPFGAFLYVRT